MRGLLVVFNEVGDGVKKTRGYPLDKDPSLRELADRARAPHESLLEPEAPKTRQTVSLIWRVPSQSVNPIDARIVN